jgi:hypothetical protein
MNPWWTEQTGTLIGSIGGAAIGVVGGGLGAIGGYLLSRGKAAGPVVVSVAGLGVVGLGLLAVGAYASFSGQPYHVHYPLMLGGSVLTGVCAPLVPVVFTAGRVGEARRSLGRDAAPAEVQSAAVRATMDLWAEGAPAWRWSKLLAGALLALGVLALSLALYQTFARTAVPNATALSPARESFGWWMAALGLLIAGALLTGLLLTIRKQVAHVGRMLEQQRLAAAELRRA